MSASANDSGRLDGDAGFPARSFLRSAGLSAADVRRRPVIGVCNSWSELTPCNLPLGDVAAAVKRGVSAAGGIALEFPTISLSEAFIRPTTMLLRNLMAMDVEEMIARSPIDGVVLLNGCDKTIAAQLMGAVSAGKPALSLGAGHRREGHWRGEALTIDDSWRLADERRTGAIDDAGWAELEGCLSPATGVCNVLGTAVTLAMVAEVLGFALPGSALLPAGSSARLNMAEQTGRDAVAAVAAKRRPHTMVTNAAVRDAWRVVCAVGGSTNAVIHLQAIARRAGVVIGMDEFAVIARRTPTLVRVKPNGPYSLSDLEADGGVPAVLRELGDLVELDRPCAAGKTWAQSVAALPSGARSGALKTRADPVDPVGALVVLHGTLAPSGAVIKRSAAMTSLLRHRGPALVLDGLAALDRLDDPELEITADTVLVLRGCGPRGAPGMPEVGGVPIPARLYRAGVRDMVRISDARMSGTAAGTVVLHVAPEAAVGGPLALVRDGDLIDLDVDAGRLDLMVTDDELRRRIVAQLGAQQPSSRGYERLYQLHVTQADEGCDFDFLSGVGDLSTDYASSAATPMDDCSRKTP